MDLDSQCGIKHIQLNNSLSSRLLMDLDGQCGDKHIQFNNVLCSRLLDSLKLGHLNPIFNPTLSWIVLSKGCFEIKSILIISSQANFSTSHLIVSHLPSVSSTKCHLWLLLCQIISIVRSCFVTARSYKSGEILRYEKSVELFFVDIVSNGWRVG